MPIDTSMYANFKPADMSDALESGMRMRDMLDKRRAGEAQQAEAQGLKKAMQQSAVQNPDGTMSYDRGRLMSEMAKINPEKAMQMQEQLKAQDMSNLESNLKKTDYTARILGSINSPETFQRGISDAEALGLDVAPYKTMQYAEFQSIQPALMRRTLTAKEQLAQQLAEQAESRLGRQTNLDEKKFAAEPVRAERAFQNQLALKAAEAGYAGEQQGRQFAHGEKIEGIRAGNQSKLSAQQAEQQARLKAIADAAGGKNGQDNLVTPFGIANTEMDAKELKGAFEAKQSFDDKLQQMIALREKHGGGAILNREDVQRGKQLSKDLLLKYKDMAKLGVLSKADEDILNTIIPADPLQYNSPLAAIQGQDPTLHRLKQFKADSERDFQTKVKTRTRAGVGSAAVAGKYEQMSDSELAALYQQRMKGAKNAKP